MEQTNIPEHVAIIMDGNGRWAKARGLPRSEGHREGLKAAKRVVAAACDAGIPYLSLYAFSTENWKRTQEEVGFLMGLIRTYLVAELDFYRKRNIRVVHSGDRSGLPAEIIAELDSVSRDTACFTACTLNLAINYGGRDEIVRAVRRALAADRTIASGEQVLTETLLRRYVDQPELPDPDLVIRSSGELRISNFLLWQSAYSEFYFSPTYWPDFTAADLQAALADYAGRIRRYGGL